MTWEQLSSCIRCPGGVRYWKSFRLCSLWACSAPLVTGDWDWGLDSSQWRYLLGRLTGTDHGTMGRSMRTLANQTGSRVAMAEFHCEWEWRKQNLSDVDGWSVEGHDGKPSIHGLLPQLFWLLVVLTRSLQPMLNTIQPSARVYRRWYQPATTRHQSLPRCILQSQVLRLSDAPEHWDANDLWPWNMFSSV